MLRQTKSALQTITRLVLGRAVHDRFDPTSYWEARANKFGRRSVLNLAHSNNAFDAVTARQKNLLFPLLRTQLDGSEKKVLDFGCGPGRFTADLATIVGGCATGVDISRTLINIAPEAPNTIYETISWSSPLIHSKRYDLIWVCLVLGGISDNDLGCIIDCLEDCLAVNGLVFLVENTATRKDTAHWKYRTAEQYANLFLSVKLKLIGTYMDCGEEISVLAGRRNEK